MYLNMDAFQLKQIKPKLMIFDSQLNLANERFDNLKRDLGWDGNWTKWSKWPSKHTPPQIHAVTALKGIRIPDAHPWVNVDQLLGTT